MTPPRASLPALTALAAAVGLTRWVKVEDPDVWWHIATGRWLLAHGGLASPDPFSSTAGRGVSYSEVLADVGYALAWDGGGARGLIALQVGLSTLLAVLVLALGAVGRGARLPVGLAAVLLGLFVANAGWRLHTRTETFSTLGLAGLLLLLARAERAGPAWLAALPPLFLLWANLHRGFSLGLLVLGLVALTWLGQRRFALGLAALGALAACALAACLNLGGWRTVLAGADLLSRSTFQTLLPEWHAPGLRFLTREKPLLLVALGLVVVGAARARDRPWLLAAALPCVGLAATSVRFTALAVVGTTPLLALGLDRVAGLALARGGRSIRPAVGRLLAVGLGVGIMAASYLAGAPGKWGTGVVDWQVPVAPAEFLEKHPPAGRMYNSFRFGGYLVFAGGLERPVFIDGRNDTLYEPEHFRRTVLAHTHPEVLREQLAQHDVGWAILDCRGLACDTYRELWRDPAWALVYMDDQASILVRRAAQREEYLAAHAYRALTPLDAARRFERLRGDPDAPALLADLGRLLEQSPGSARAHYLAALAQRQLGDQAAAEDHRRAFSALVRERGGDAAPP